MGLLKWVMFVVVGFVVGYYWRKKVSERSIGTAEKKAEDIVSHAKKEADRIVRNAEIKVKEEVYELKKKAEHEINQRRKELRDIENTLKERAEVINKKGEFVESKEKEIREREKDLTEKERELREREKNVSVREEEVGRRIEHVAKMTESEARKYLLDKVKGELKVELGKMIKDEDEKVREEVESKAKEIIALALQRYAGDYVGDITVSVVQLPNDEMKGRIIGREGRNIRTFEALTGVDVIIDDTPEAVVLSSPNPLRRELARITMTKLVEDGRIHPARIEEVFRKAQEELGNKLRKAGEEAFMELGLPVMSKDVLMNIGKLKFRMSYSQNVYVHSIEVAHMAGIMAAELKLDQKLAKRIGLLHDIGKAIDHEVEGNHAEIGAEVLRRFGETEEVVDAVRTHHEDRPANIYGVIIQAADALSAARPGVRKEMYEAYIKRVEELERVAVGFKGVEKAYAIQAGRELRILVDATVVSDDEAAFLAREIAKRIEEEVRYPGQVKVVVLREFRSVEYAR